MHRTNRKWVALLLVPILMQVGVATRAARNCDNPDNMRDSGMAAGAEHVGHHHTAPSGLSSRTVELRTGDELDADCRQPDMGCGCPGCVDYFQAHALSLPAVFVDLGHAPVPDTYSSTALASMIGVDTTPPTPPPRS